MGLDEMKAKYQEGKEERKRKKISEMMLGESRVMCRSDLGKKEKKESNRKLKNKYC